MPLPKVSVIMLAYNSAKYLPEAIESVLNQTFRDFEFLIVVEPGSMDRTNEIVNQYAEGDSRIRVAIQPTPGLTAARIFAWPLAQGKYIAWADSDDFCLPERLNKQVALMDNRPDIGICGAWIKVIGTGKPRIQKYFTDDASIRSLLPFYSPLANPTVMMRRSLFTQDGLDYDPKCLYCEDYELWSRASLISNFANLNTVLVNYRLHQTQMSQRASDVSRQSSNRIRLRQLQRLNIIPTDEEFKLHESICFGELELTSAALDRAENWFLKLNAANHETKSFPLQAFSKVLADYWYWICYKAARRSGMWAIPRIFRFPLMSPDVLSNRVINNILALQRG